MNWKLASVMAGEWSAQVGSEQIIGEGVLSRMEETSADES
jgi:hypothetical protein